MSVREETLGISFECGRGSNMKITKNLHWAIIVLLSISCGKNALRTSETADPAEDATLKLEDQDPEAAIEILEEALLDEPKNAMYTSILATAYAQKAGVEPLQFAQKFVENEANAANDSDDNEFTLMFAITPDPTATVLSDINYSVTLLNSIAEANRLPGDEFKLAIFQTAAVVLQTKAFDADLDGDITAEEIANLSASDASTILAALGNASTLLGGTSGDDTSSEAEGSIDNVISAINDSPGSTDQEKLQNYLANNSNE